MPIEYYIWVGIILGLFSIYIIYSLKEIIYAIFGDEEIDKDIDGGDIDGY